MAIFKMAEDKNSLSKVDPTSFGEEGVLERADLQRLLRDQPEVLEEGLLIISEEFGDWQDSNRRIDLLGLDAECRLVVIELKRGETGGHMDLQAIRYAAMAANMTFQQTVDTYQAYLEKRASQEGTFVEGDAAETAIRDHLRNPEGEANDIHTEVPRIILVSENFGKELTTCVMWLNDSWLRSAGLEIKCLRLQPHRNGNEILIETSVAIPLPEASDYQTQLGQREQETREVSAGQEQHIHGADAFQESIRRTPETFKPGLNRLYATAIEMEDADIAELSTRINRKGNGYRLDLIVPGKGQSLVSFGSYLTREGEIHFWPAEDYIALESLLRIEELIGPVTSKSGWRHRRLSRIDEPDLEAILTAIRDVYREASGL